jgi:hypothetical protein
MKNYILLNILLLILISTVSFCQIDKSVELKEFSFGKAWFYNDTSDVIGLGNQKDKEGVVNANNIYFIKDTKLDQYKLQKLVTADELRSIWLFNININVFAIGSPFGDSLKIIDKNILLTGSDIIQLFILEKTRFIKGLMLNGNNFPVYNSTIKDCEFLEEFVCANDSFKQTFDIDNSYFHNKVDIHGNVYRYSFRIFNSSFDSTLELYANEFYNSLWIQDSKINNLTISHCSFPNRPILRRLQLTDTVDFSNTDFEKGVDLRRIDFQNVSTIFLDNTSYPLGELVVYWENIKGIDKPKISLKYKSGNDEDDYKSIEEIYLQVKNNFLAQGDKITADNILYELAWQKEIIVGGFWQWLYGFTLGYGFEPIRYLFFPVIITIIFFWVIWYFKYYNIVAYVLNKDLDEDLGVSPHYNVKFPTKKLWKYEVIDHNRISPNINFITRMWHSLHFSTSVLLGIRFKKDWIRFSSKHKSGVNSFLWIVSFEYILGKVYLILLIILIKIHTFENWKSFLGL